MKLVGHDYNCLSSQFKIQFQNDILVLYFCLVLVMNKDYLLVQIDTQISINVTQLDPQNVKLVHCVGILSNLTVRIK